MRYRAKKCLGQNFLIDPNIQRKIIEACDIKPKENILEIGPGTGALTKLIAGKTPHALAVEIDPALCTILKEALTENSRVKVINQSILTFDVGSHFKAGRAVKVIGNLPYNITTPIIAHLFKFYDIISDIFVTVQKEFAARMVAQKGDDNWSSFSCFLQYYTHPKQLFLIKNTCFRPVPKVDSAFVKLSMKKKLPLDKEKEKRLFLLIHSSFQQRRKTLRNALRGVVTDNKLQYFFSRYGFNSNIRGEELSLEDFINLTNVN